MCLKKAVAITFISVLISVHAFSQNWDIDLLTSINHNESSFKNSFCNVISNSVIVFNIAAPLSVFSAGVIRHDKQLKEDAAYMVGGYIVSSIVTQGMKVIIQRPRPYITYPDIIQKNGGWWLFHAIRPYVCCILYSNFFKSAFPQMVCHSSLLFICRYSRVCKNVPGSSLSNRCNCWSNSWRRQCLAGIQS